MENVNKLSLDLGFKILGANDTDSELLRDFLAATSNLRDVTLKSYGCQRRPINFHKVANAINRPNLLSVSLENASVNPTDLAHFPGRFLHTLRCLTLVRVDIGERETWRDILLWIGETLELGELYCSELYCLYEELVFRNPLSSAEDSHLLNWRDKHVIQSEMTDLVNGTRIIHSW